ncbi:MAG: potassium-transporting ATPase subunit KdpA [Proteobacteria bacterium]|nr:potassium-transporting ATPase subunit KdpA [Pseudomonadota bacterium]
MNVFDVIQIAISLLVLLLIGPYLGSFIYKIFEDEHLLPRFLRKIENGFYRTCSIDSKIQMNWKTYTVAMLVFNAVGFAIVFLLQMFQAYLPLNPQNLPIVSWHSAFNTAVSFMTNTNWQGYSGESTMSYLTQMLGLTVQNFVSAATGIAVAVALCRGLTRPQGKKIGNFWTDLYRGTIYLLLPLSILLALVLSFEGVVQSFAPYLKITGLDGIEQIIPQGPAASQVAIKQLGTNGGGFFGVNSAHPLENPTPFSNWLQLISILLIPVSLVFTFGEYAKSKRQAWAIFSAMAVLLVVGLGVSLYAEYSGNPLLGGIVSMEGKETRFGIANSILWSVFTTSASNGSVNAMHSSLSPLSGAIAMFNIMLGEIIFGGAGAGLYGMILFVLMTVFLSGLMVGRTPEYLGKKIESREIQMVILGLLLPSACILLGAGLSSVFPVALSSLANQGPHGLSEILYAFSSAAGNNGSAFAGLNANTVYYNLALGIAMLVGRFGVIIPILCIAGSMAEKRQAAAGSGTFPTDSALFVLLLIGVILIVGGLTFLPTLALGPVIEHLLMVQGVTF